MATKKVSAVDIKELYYGEIDLIKEDLTAEALKTLLAKKGTELKQVTNIHQDTWTIEEAEASQESYTDQLSGLTYRRGAKTMGDLTFNFTIGRYDYATKKDFIGGATIGENGWKRSRGAKDIEYCLIALTEDDQYCILPVASIKAREAQTDKAIGIAVVGTMLIPEVESVAPEYWFDKSAVDAES